MNSDVTDTPCSTTSRILELIKSLPALVQRRATEALSDSNTMNYLLEVRAPVAKKTKSKIFCTSGKTAAAFCEAGFNKYLLFQKKSETSWDACYKIYPLLWLHELKQGIHRYSLSHSVAPCTLFSDCRALPYCFPPKL